RPACLSRLSAMGGRSASSSSYARNRSRGLYSGANLTGRDSAKSPFQMPRLGQLERTRSASSSFAIAWLVTCWMLRSCPEGSSVARLERPFQGTRRAIEDVGVRHTVHHRDVGEGRLLTTGSSGS